MTHRSPWIHQLKRERKIDVLEEDASADVVVIGGGIAGVTTAFFILKNTQHSVALLEAGKVAHGATGHNAGQIASYFERPFADVAREYGLESAAQGWSEVSDAWKLLDEIYSEAKLTTQYMSFTGYAGFSSITQVLSILEDLSLQSRAGVRTEYLFVANDAPFEIPQEYSQICERIPREQLLSLLESKDPSYIAAIATRKGCLNSALFTEELAGYLIARYPQRFKLFEHTPAERVVLRKNDATVETMHHHIQAKKVVLCTNGFRQIKFSNETGSGDIDASFHEQVHGVVGSMMGFVDEANRKPIAISYVMGEESHSPIDLEPYFYLTRRPFDAYTLMCVGGPEHRLNDKEEYSSHVDYFPFVHEKFERFLDKTYIGEERLVTAFQWHGLMGYTKSGLRLIGPEPCNDTLLYNLGCNGVGILTSIYGARRIARFLAGETVETSIFDPKDSRCAAPKPLSEPVLNQKRRAWHI